MMESSMKTISRPVIDRLPVGQLDEFACRQLDRVRVLPLSISTVRVWALSYTCNVPLNVVAKWGLGSCWLASSSCALTLRAGCAESKIFIRWSLLSIACTWRHAQGGVDIPVVLYLYMLKWCLHAF